MTPRHAWARTFVLLTIVLDVPVLARIVRALTPEPHVETIELDGVPIDGSSRRRRQVAGVPLRERRPSGAPPGADRPASDPRARARGFRRRRPGLAWPRRRRLTPRTFERGAGRDSDAADRPEVRDGVQLAGAPAGAGIALVTAADPKLSERISVVAAVVPFADIERIACLATTSRYVRDGTSERYEVTALMRRVVGRSLVTALRLGEDRSALLAELFVARTRMTSMPCAASPSPDTSSGRGAERGRCSPQ